MTRTFRLARIRAVLLALALVAAAGYAPAGAQSVVVDEGVFTLFVDGREVGTESFTIHRQGSADEATFLANAVVTVDGPEGSFEMRPTLRTGTDRTPGVYQSPIENSDVSNVEVRNMGRRFVATISSAAGQQDRELRAEQGTRLLDRWVAHHHWFLGEVTQGQSIPVLIPRTGEQVRLTVESAEVGALNRGGQNVEARRVSLTGEGEDRTVWFDDQGRVLEVEVPGRSYRAVRQGS